MIDSDRVRAIEMLIPVFFLKRVLTFDLIQSSKIVVVQEVLLQALSY